MTIDHMYLTIVVLFALETPAIKDMASNLERKWRQLLATSSEDSKRMDVDSAEGGSRQLIKGKRC